MTRIVGYICTSRVRKKGGATCPAKFLKVQIGDFEMGAHLPRGINTIMTTLIRLTPNFGSPPVVYLGPNFKDLGGWRLYIWGGLMF